MSSARKQRRGRQAKCFNMIRSVSDDVVAIGRGGTDELLLLLLFTHILTVGPRWSALQKPALPLAEEEGWPSAPHEALAAAPLRSPVRDALSCKPKWEGSEGGHCRDETRRALGLRVAQLGKHVGGRLAMLVVNPVLGIPDGTEVPIGTRRPIILRRRSAHLSAGRQEN